VINACSLIKKFRDLAMSESRYAGFWTRVAASLLDGIITGIIGILVNFLVNAVLKNTSAVLATSNFINLIIAWLYYALQESSPKQATLGKQALGIYVTDLDGNQITFLKATLRYFAKILSTLILFIGYIMVAFTEKKQGLHDMLAGTLVLKRQ
jgi:uncharacterized RDD family membrane protein YckC